MYSRRISALRRPGGFLAGLLACWLLTQALGQAHALLHLRRAVGTASAAAAAQAPARPTDATPAPGGVADAAVPGPAFFFHPRGEAALGDDGACRLYALFAQGDAAPGPPPVATASARRCAATPALAARAVAALAPRRGAQARAPPAAG